MKTFKLVRVRIHRTRKSLRSPGRVMGEPGTRALLHDVGLCEAVRLAGQTRTFFS
ncbi:MAG: hypothetical protein ABJQ70_19090 [Roseobacter sp.]